MAVACARGLAVMIKIAKCMSYFTCQTSHVTRHTLHLKPHTSHLTPHAHQGITYEGEFRFDVTWGWGRIREGGGVYEGEIRDGVKV